MDKDKAIKIAREYIKKINNFINVKNAYLFGSHAHNTQKDYSDIDIGIFTENPGDDYFTILKKLYAARRSIDVRIEPHLFIIGSDRSGFLEEVKKTGIQI